MRRVRQPNRHQGQGNLNRPRRVGTAGPSRPSLGGLGKPAVAKPGLGAAPTAPAPAPKAPPPPAPVGQHFVPDAAYNNEVDAATQATEHTLSGLNDKERAIKFDFGIDDPTNPNSRAMGMKRAFLARAKGTSAGLAAQHHLYSGSHERGMANVRRDQEFATADLRRQYEGQLSDVREARYQANEGRTEAGNTAFENWLLRHQDEQPVVPGSQPKPAAAAKPKAPATAPNQKAKADAARSKAQKAAAKAEARARARAKKQSRKGHR